jgi:hypothetical protein
MTDDSGGEVDREVEMLGSELSRLSVENQSAWALFASLIGVTLVAAGGYLALNDSRRIADWTWAALGVLPLLVLSYVVSILCQQVQRSYYARDIERRLSALHAPRGDNELPPHALESLVSHILSNRRGFTEIRTIYWIEYSAIATAFITAGIVSIVHIDIAWLTVVVAFLDSVLVAASLKAVHRSVVLGRSTFAELRAKTVQLLGETRFEAQRKREERRLISYLALPRPSDFLVKAVMLHLVSGLVGAWLARDSTDWSTSLRYAVISFISFECFLYQARYMINDYQGRNDDPLSVDRDVRGRVPRLDDEPIRKGAFFLTLVLRVLGAAVFPLLLPRRLGLVLLGSLVAVTLLAAAYEGLRRREGSAAATSDITSLVVGLYALVGVSYGIRVGVGLFLGSEGLVPNAVLLVSAVAFYFSGLSTVLMAWALEATGYLKGEEDHTLSVSKRLSSKIHLLPLARLARVCQHQWESKESPYQQDAMARGEEYLPLRNERVLLHQDRLSQPWNWLLVLASGVGLGAGWIGRHGILEGPSKLAPVAVLCGIVAGAATVQAPKTMLAAIVAQFAGILIYGARRGDFRYTFVVLPLLVVTASYVVTRGMRYRDTVDLPKKLRELPAQLFSQVVKAVKAIIR